MDSSRIQGAGKKSLLHQDCASETGSPLVWERLVQELMSLGAPPSTILNTLCTAIDIQIGGIVSLVLPSNWDARDFHALTQSPDAFGLHAFCSAPILSESGALLGTLEVLCCDPRSPTADELRVIERVTHLAAAAIQGRPRELVN
jgi:GAF domain-containing protein